jgi:nitrogen fixation protein NifU and related proteins
MAMSEKEFDDYVDNLQEKVFAEAKEAYGAKGFDRWRNPKYHGRVENPDGYARVTGGCGDTIEMTLKIENENVVGGAFTTTGCASSGLCGSFAVEMAIGKTVESIFELKGQDVLDVIGTFPEDDAHCAFLAIETLHEAVNNYMVRAVGIEKEI